MTRPDLASLLLEARSWVADCQWKEWPEELDLTDDEVIDGVDRHYDDGWVQFQEDCDTSADTDAAAR